MADKSLELYVHIPFCVRKCEYCDFLSAPAGADRKSQYSHFRTQNGICTYNSNDLSAIFIPRLISAHS